MSRYRKTMRQAIEEGLSNMQIAILKREYAPFKGKTISAARAKQLMNILDKFKEDDLKKLGKETIPFVSSGARSKLAVRNMKFKVSTINPFKEEVTQEDFDLEEGKMKTIATMFSQGKSAEEIAKKMKLPVDTVKSILGENAPTDADMKRMKKLGMKPQKEDVQEAKFRMEGEVDYKNKPNPEDFEMVVNASNRNDAMKQAEINLSRGGKKINALEFSKVVKEDIDEAIKPFMLSYSDRFGKHAGFEDAKSLQDLQTKAANLRKKGFKIDKMGRYNPPVNMKDAFDPLTEACWTGYKQVGMKKKGGKMVPNCVPEDFKVEEYITEEDDTKKLENELKQKENEIAALKQKAETDKAKNVQKSTDKMVNPETGEPLLQVGIAYKHLKDKMAKEKAAEADRKEKKAADMKNTISKLKDKIKESALNESAASDKAKAMGLDYMKFGRYGKDGKVTHKVSGDSLVKVSDKDAEEPAPADKTPKNDPAVDNPEVDVKPKIDPFDAQKDLEDMVTDGMIDVEDDGEGGLEMSKEYEPSQDYEAERDVKSIKQYLKDKGIDEKDVYVDIDGSEEDEYLQINVKVRGQKSESVMPKKKKVDISPEHDAVEKKEDADYLKPRLNPSQIANIKKTWQDKKPGDVTPAVKKMIKNMDIPTQLAIKHANIKFLSGLVEGKYTRYSDLLIQYGRFMQAKDYIGARRIKKDIEAEKKKLGIKEDLNQDDEKVIKKVKDMLKGASAKHAAQAKMIDKALKSEADLTKSQIKKVHDKADELPKKSFRDRYGKEKGDSVRYGVATKMVKKKLNIENKNHPAKEIYESIAAVRKKAEKSGMPYSVLKKVYDRGMAAWRGGHRPGATQVQWALARVNSFVTKSSGTWGGADKDLAKQVRGSK